MRYKINQQFFDVIDSEEKAYFLGLLFADGHNNTKDGVVLIDLQKGDEMILQTFTDLLQPDKPIKFYENTYSIKGRFRMSIANRHISNKLLELGMVHNKSEKLKEVNNIPEHLIHHFVRGYFDGNGSIGIFGKVKNVEFSICSTKEFLEYIQCILIKNCNLNKVKFGKRHKNRESNSYHLKYTGKFSCQRIRDWLYKDSKIYLNRKYYKFYSF